MQNHIGPHPGLRGSTMEAQEIAEDQPFSQTREMLEGLLERLGSAETMAMEHRALEALVKEEGRKVLNRALQDHLSLRGLGEVPGGKVTGADGEVRGRRRKLGRPLLTMVGPVVVPRVGYRGGVAGALAPVDAELNLPKRKYSHGIRRAVAGLASRMPFDDVGEELALDVGVRVGKRQVEELARDAAQDFDAYYTERATEVVSEDASILVLSFDATGVRVRPEALRGPTRQLYEASEPEQWPRPSKSKRPVGHTHNKRMASVSVVYEVAPYVRSVFDIVRALRGEETADENRPARPRPQAKQIRTSLKAAMAPTIRDGFDEAKRRDPQHDKHWVAVVDGDENQLNYVLREARRLQVELTIVLDIIHVAQYVWKAGKALLPNDKAARHTWVWERLTSILWGEASTVAAGMRRSATMRKLDDRERKDVDVCANYLLKYQAYMRYHLALADGLPIGSGVVEGACRHAVKDRMAVTGARWGLEGGEAVLRLRALRSNGDLDDFFDWKEAREHAEIHLSRYAEAKPPALVGPGREKPPLRLVS